MDRALSNSCLNRFFSLALLLSAIFVGAAASPAPAPATSYFRVVDMASGLPDNSINYIAEDNYGFLWVATWNGLARFDGKNIEIYRNTGSPGSLSNNMVRCLYPTPDGLWVGTDQGLDFFSFADSRFEPSYYISDTGSRVLLEKRVSHVMGHGNYILALTGDGEILRLDPRTTGDRNVFNIIPKPLSRIYADFVPYTRGRIMAISNEGITVLSNDCERELYHNNIRRHFDPNMNLLCDTVGGKVYAGAGIGSETIVCDILSPDGRLAPDLRAPRIKGVMRVAQDGDHILMATDGNGIYSLAGGAEPVNFIPGNSSLPCDAFYHIFVDSHHNLWCGSYRHGLCMLSHELNAYVLANIASGSLNYDIVTAIVPEGKKIYLGLDGGGLDVYDNTTGTSRNFNASNSALPANNVVSLVSDGSALWGAVYSGGLIHFDPVGQTFTTYRVDNSHEQGEKLWVICDDGQGNIWTGGLSLHVFDKEKKTFDYVEGTNLLGIMSLTDDGHYIWAATRTAGVLKIDKRTRKIAERYSDSPTPGAVAIQGHHTPFIFLDSSRRLWINVSNDILCSIEIDSGKEAVVYDAHSGLGNFHVQSMVEDPQGDLWIGTDDGLFKYIRSRNVFVRKNDSRVPPSYTPNATAVVGNTAYFGTTNGLLSFPMTAGAPEAATAATVFTGVKILDKDGTFIPLYTCGENMVELDNDQNFFTVSFSVPEMSNPDQMQFECRLAGLEDVWRDVSSTRTATYTNVPQGKYELLVRHTKPDGTWTEPAAMGLRVRPAWYSSVAMISVWFILAFAVIMFMLHLWHKYIQNKEQTQLVEIEHDSQRRLSEAKLDFYASITHELRTPCFLIAAQIEEIFDSERQTIPVSYLSGIYRNSAKLNKLINHIIDFRKNDTGYLKLFARNIELVKYFTDLTLDYEQLCRQKSLDFTFEHDDAPIVASIDPDKLEQIVTNLISNSYKYTPKGGSVKLAVLDRGDNVEISVSDTGIGIVDKLQASIFKPFFRTERGQNESKGDGIGLAFVKELVELHRGTISLESQVNQGSTFTVVLPKAQPGAVPDETDNTPPLSTLEPPEIKPLSEIIVNPTATRSILIVDDDPEVSNIVARTFEDDYRVSRACDGAHGLELARTGHYDVIITDLMMPETDGHQLVRELKADKKTRHIKVIVFSALTGEEDMLKAFDEGADAYITKPTPLKVLRKQVERLFEADNEPPLPSAPPGSPGAYNREEQKFLLECRRIIDENMTDVNFGIEMLAGKLAMSHSTLYKKIRRLTGMSLIDFINEYRVCKAVALFRQGNTNVQKVSEMCGFRDIKTFRETFKRKMNMPPKQFIQQLAIGAKTDAQAPANDSPNI